MYTIIVDLFHPEPESLGEEGALHDIIGTSEASVQLCLHYKNPYRLYYCEDIDQELRAIKWHHQDCTSTKSNLSLIDVCDIDGIPGEITKPIGEFRLIINGQGYIDPANRFDDSIGGLDVESFIEALGQIMEALHIDGKKRKLTELQIFSCGMAHSHSFVNTLYSTFKNDMNLQKNGIL